MIHLSRPFSATDLRSSRLCLRPAQGRDAEVRMFYQYASSSLSTSIRITLHPGFTNILLPPDTTYSFDGAGRLLTAFCGDRLYKRGLDHRIMEKRRERLISNAPRTRRDLAETEKVALIDSVRYAVRQILSELPLDVPRAVRQRLMALAEWDDVAYGTDSRRFAEIYHSVPILPPDQYLSLVLQPTEGCPYNWCNFCTFYRDRLYGVKSPEVFHEHIEEVREFFGAGLSLRRTIFLADANALAVPLPRLLTFFDMMHEAFRIAPPDLEGRDLIHWKTQNPDGIVGIYSFMDAFTGRQTSVEKFKALKARGLRRIYIGVESGHVPLLCFLRKPSMPEDVERTVQAAKAAGISISLIVMVGVGGDHYAEGHVTDTIRLLNRLQLTSSDIVYFSGFVEDPTSEYYAAARNIGIHPLTTQEMQAQEQAIRDGLRWVERPQCSIYDIREFVY